MVAEMATSTVGETVDKKVHLKVDWMVGLLDRGMVVVMEVWWAVEMVLISVRLSVDNLDGLLVV